MTRWARVFVSLLTLGGGAIPVRAQEPAPWARLETDTVLSWRTVATEGADLQVTFLADSVSAVRLADGVTVVGRSVAWRSHGDEWRGRIAQMTLRYERSGRVGVRVEGGFLASPVGLAALEVRANANPTILAAMSSDQALPTFDAGVPRVSLYALTYPLGIQASFSSGPWDGRVAIVDSSPMRSRSPFLSDQPHAAAQLVAGGGLTPRPGLRFGGWWAQGVYARASEIGKPGGHDRSAMLGGLEMEYAFGHSRLAAEAVAASLDTTLGRQPAAGWMFEGMHALTPRWFAAGRLRIVQGPWRSSRHIAQFEEEYAANCAAGCADSDVLGAEYPMHVWHQSAGELTVGYRLSRELTLRGGIITKRAYGANRWQNSMASSLVWARRWF
jgi:hypothetical protein